MRLRPYKERAVSLVIVLMTATHSSLALAQILPEIPPIECLTLPPKSEAAVWSASVPPTLDELARCAAPIVWMSPDERETPEGPSTYAPCVGNTPPAASGPPRVYVGKMAEKGTRGREDWLVRLRYHFYYRSDPSHCGDLEGVSMRLEAHREEGVYEVRLVTVEAGAHGNPFFANRLRVKDRVRLPISILVEENKHASVPDRNGDGYYTPGQDVNWNVRDAWGLRDNFGDGLFASAFDASMAKATRATFADITRYFPPRPAEGAVKRWSQYSGRTESWVDTRSYELEWVSENVEPGKRSPHEYRNPWSPGLFASMLIPSYRAEPDRQGLSVGAPFVGPAIVMNKLRWLSYSPVNIGPKVMVAWDKQSGKQRWRMDVGVSPSFAGRLLDWYATVSANIDGPREAEAGARFRWKPPLFADRVPLLGFRVGVRSRVPRLSNQRLIFEIGNGYF